MHLYLLLFLGAIKTLMFPKQAHVVWVAFQINPIDPGKQTPFG